MSKSKKQVQLPMVLPHIKGFENRINSLLDRPRTEQSGGYPGGEKAVEWFELQREYRLGNRLFMSFLVKKLDT